MNRWMGKWWSKPDESSTRDVVTPDLSVKKRTPMETGELGLMVRAEEPPGELGFGRIEVPQIHF